MSKYTMEEFCEVVEHIKALQEYEDALYSVQREYVNRFDCLYHETGSFPTLESDLVDSLVKMFDDEDNWIPWWIYETDFGSDAPEVTTSDGIKYIIGTSEQLYYILNGEWDKLESHTV